MCTCKWIVVTGLDGSGKTTLVDNLCTWLTSQGKRVKRDRFPHDEYLTKKLLNRCQDPYTDRLLFALDNRLTATIIQEALESGEYDYVITQRGFLDSFVHGAVQGYDYATIEFLNRFADFPQCDIMIHMVAEATEAFSRIQDDPDADKFEFLEYIEKQEFETRRAYKEVALRKSPALVSLFRETVNIYVDTTQMTTDEVFDYITSRIKQLL